MCKISKKNIFASLLAVSMIFTMMSTTVVHAQSVKDGSNEVTVTPKCWSFLCFSRRNY